MNAYSAFRNMVSAVEKNEKRTSREQSSDKSLGNCSGEVEKIYDMPPLTLSLHMKIKGKQLLRKVLSSIAALSHRFYLDCVDDIRL